MLPTYNGTCCDCCDCISDITRPCNDINRRNRRIDKIKEDPERAATITRYGWTGIIGAIFAIGLQILFFFLSYKIVTESIQSVSGTDIKSDLEAIFINMLSAPIGFVLFILAVVAGVSGSISAFIYGRHQKRLNDKAIGKVATLFGFVCLAVMIAGCVIVLMSL